MSIKPCECFPTKALNLIAFLAILMLAGLTSCKSSLENVTLEDTATPTESFSQLVLQKMGFESARNGLY